MTETDQEVQAAEAVDFGLRPGMTVEVLTTAGRLALLGKVESFSDGAVLIRDAKGNELPRITYNEELRLRFSRGEDTTLIQGKICGSSQEIWKLDRLESKSFKEQRAFFRQGISTSIQAECFRHPIWGITEERGEPCRVLDVSAGGLLFSSKEIYGLGDILTIAGIRLVESMPPFRFNCLVRRVGVPERGGVIRYGCQFESIPPKEQDRLLQAIFTVQREEIRSQKKRDQL